MADTLARNDRAQASRMTNWTPFRDLLGFDPFHSLRSNWGLRTRRHAYRKRIRG
jgi:hypothetical protein